MVHFTALLNYPVDDADTFCQWLLSDFSLDGETVMLAPASGFYANPGMGRKEVRIAYVLEKKSLLRSLTILKKGIRNLSRKNPTLVSFSDILWIQKIWYNVLFAL
jgi:aspartate aminotransferase